MSLWIQDEVGNILTVLHVPSWIHFLCMGLHLSQNLKSHHNSKSTAYLLNVAMLKYADAATDI